MLIIRLQRKKVKQVVVKHMYDVLVVDKGKAPQSKGFVSNLGTFNTKTNVLLLNMDLFFLWVGRGVHFSTAAYKLLRSIAF